MSRTLNRPYGASRKVYFALVTKIRVIEPLYIARFVHGSQNILRSISEYSKYLSGSNKILHGA